MPVMNAPAPRGIPLRPDPLARDREQRRSIIRAITSVALSGDQSAEKILARAWPNDHQALMVVEASERERLGKAAVTPATLASSGFPAAVSVDVLPSLAPMSAAVRLFARCMQINLDRKNQVSVPRGVPGMTPIFIGEGKPVPVVRLSFTSGMIGPARKILVSTAISNELDEAGPEAASDVIGRLLAEATTRSLDGVVFDSNADDGIRPAGLLHGLAAQPASTSTGLAAIAADLASLAGAIGDAAVDAADMVIVANPRQAIQLKLLSGPKFDYPVFDTPMVPAKRIVAVAPLAVASAYSGVPTIEKKLNPAVHFEDTNPKLIVDAAGNAAAPVLSGFQSGMISIRVRCWGAWSVVAPGVAYCDNVNW
jgi:hypothetical protein